MVKKKRVILLLIVLLLSVVPGYSGGSDVEEPYIEIRGKVVFEKKNSPYTFTKDVIVTSKSSLVIKGGTKLMLGPDVNIYVYGNIRVLGTEEEPVFFTSTSNQSPWGAICIKDASGPSLISHAVVEKASKCKQEPEYFKAAISSFKSDLEMNHIVLENNDRGIYTEGGDIKVKNCTFREGNKGQHINIRSTQKARIEKNVFYASGEGDAIDIDVINEGYIIENKIFASNDDGIDLGSGCRNIYIEKNSIFNCKDKGISVGEGSNVKIENNFISNADIGIAVKDSSRASVIRCSFWGNNIAVKSYESHLGYGGGTVEVKGSIILNSKKSAILVDEFSTLVVTYTFCNTGLIPGKENALFHLDWLVLYELALNHINLLAGAN